MEYDKNLLDSYFCYLGEWGNTKMASEHCAISVSTGRTLESKYPDRYEQAMFEYRETLRGELIKRIKNPEEFSERLLLKELEMVDHRYRTKVEVQHNHSIELVGRLQRAKERMLTLPGGDEPVNDRLPTLGLIGIADSKAPMMADYEEKDDEEEHKPTKEEIIDAEFTSL